jgi:asparagine synthase (glutamine-hydrolysing)
MCGIFGFVNRSKGESVELLTRAAEDLKHRGPDDSGITVVDLGPGRGEVGLAHTRLSIIDLSPLAHQPMQDPVTGSWIVFNGEIYNFCDLRRELESMGVEIRSHSDTEVILAAYRVWGEGCLDRLRGMFAFALWDARQQQLLLARDPMGIKQLYYSQFDNGFAFASEIRTILKTGLARPKLDSHGVLGYLTFGSVYEPWTIIEGISAVAPGHVLTVKDGASRVREYWNPLKSASGAGLAEQLTGPDGNSAAAQLRETLRDAVLAHLVSDVPVGIFLSGGIDSSSLVAILSHSGVRPNTFSLVFRETEFDEGPYSRAIAARFNTEHHEIEISKDDVLAALPDALRAMDQPTIDGINTYLVSAKARAAGMKVALTGLGADEMFAGYSNFRRVPKMERLAAWSDHLPTAARRSIAKSMPAFAGKSDRSRKLTELVGEESAVHPYFIARMLFAASERETLFSSEHHEDIKRELAASLQGAVNQAATLDSVNRVSYLESRCYMKNTLLRDSDFMSMAHGLELRVPFLDRTLVEACFRIPGANKLNGRLPKSLLLSSLGAELPQEIVKRPKRGFTLPFERWLRGDMRGAVERVLLGNQSGRSGLNPDAVRCVWERFLAGETTWSRPWSLYVLQNWCEQNSATA